MIGSSAAKYASEDVKTSILIGPNQPQSGIYSAWFDEGRITRKLDRNPNWRYLGKERLCWHFIYISLLNKFWSQEVCVFLKSAMIQGVHTDFLNRAGIVFQLCLLSFN